MKLIPLSLALVLLLACGGTKGGTHEEGGVEIIDDDQDGDGFSADEDCNDEAPEVHEGQPELCDNIDNDCDGEVDEGVLSTWYDDADEDGFGDPAATEDACASPEGFVSNSEDCDDVEEQVHPGQADPCDGIDNDCDGSTDEDDATLWYADGDGDGWGDEAEVETACSAPEGFVEASGDCNDEAPSAYPGAPEICDEIDNDCDLEVDEEVTAVFYEDHDGDGWGLLDQTQEACAEPAGYASEGGDCDDEDDTTYPTAPELDCTDPHDYNCDGSVAYADVDGDGWPACEECDDREGSIHPLATEVCDDIDNDCDGYEDDIDPDLDTSTATLWYEDDDGDLYGDPSDTALSCDAPAGYLANSLDCDDRLTAIHPGAAEVCDTLDNDCDSLIDDDDPDVSTSTGGTWYLDGDGDGYGSSGTALDACDLPTGYSASGTDCDDGEAAIHPSATEVCDDIDNDCDSDIDDDDSSLDPSTGTLWYADVDGDGIGDSGAPVYACEIPTGFVLIAGDCDDTSALDTDHDGSQDCDDDDKDGDGLRDEWDVLPLDATVARGPTGGLGGDGPHTVSGAETWDEWTLLDGAASAGATSLSVDDGSWFTEGDEILVLSQQGSDAGRYQVVFVAGVFGNNLSIEPSLSAAFGASSVVLVQRIPHFTTLSVPSGTTVMASPWAGAGGGVIIARATSTISVVGSMTTSALGFTGGTGVYGCCSTYPTQGESYGGAGAYSVSANGGGGGTYTITSDGGESGGGGGFGDAGSVGTDYNGSGLGNGGSSYGAASLSSWFLGSGGGAGSPDNESDGKDSRNHTGDGGQGGGLIALFASGSLSVTGSLRADGAEGQAASSGGDGEVGGGGGGSGGQLWLASPALSLSGTVTALGGDGGTSAWHNGTPYGSAWGGSGAVGRIRLDYSTLSGSSSPTAGYSAAWSE